MTTSPGGKKEMNTVHTLFVTGPGNIDGYLRLRGPAGLEMSARLFYEIIRDSRDGYGPYRVTTRGYEYSLRTADGCAVIGYHWHPLGNSHVTVPHLHLGATQLRPNAILTGKGHYPTGRITFEAVVKSAIDHGAEPVRDDWDARLAETELRHLQHRTWGG